MIGGAFAKTLALLEARLNERFALRTFEDEELGGDGEPADGDAIFEPHAHASEFGDQQVGRDVAGGVRCDRAAPMIIGVAQPLDRPGRAKRRDDHMATAHARELCEGAAAIFGLREVIEQSVTEDEVYAVIGNRKRAAVRLHI